MRPVMNLIASLEVKKSGVYSAAHAPSELHNSQSARIGANDFAPARAFCAQRERPWSGVQNFLVNCAKSDCNFVTKQL
jgi:hypothetical protein